MLELGTEATEATATGDALNLGAELLPMTWASSEPIEHGHALGSGYGHSGEMSIEATEATATPRE